MEILGKKTKVLVVGLDCAGPELIFEKFRDELPNLSMMVDEGVYGRLESCHPPITIPAWAVMFTGKSPGRLGLYGFRHRKGNSYTDPFTGLASSGSGWLQADGSTGAVGFIGNTSAGFSNTAWLGVYVYSGNSVGIDTNGPGSHGFYVDNYVGTGYHEMSWNAMVRARFNGSNVPVEMMSLAVE